LAVSNQNNPNPKESYIKFIESQSIICDRYVDIRRIDENAGDGYFSLVFKAKDVQNNKREVALKFFNPLKNDQYRIDCFFRESDLLKKLRGQPNILPLIQEKTDFDLNLMTENGITLTLKLMFYSSELGKFNIFDYIYKQRTDYLTNILFFRDICKAVQRIHKNEIMHRDLKPGNFLVYNKQYVCLSDFGTARFSSSKEKPIRNHYNFQQGDKRYTAPEILCGLHFSDDYNFYADIYSLGAILFELFAKTILSENIFKGIEIDKLSEYFHRKPENSRIEIFDGFIGGFSKNQELPSIREFDVNMPKAICYEVDILYKRLACLDYRKRERNFERIFNRINICEKVIKYLKKIERWRKNKIRRIDHA
jgi:serine/threonine protein kinase